MTFIARGNTEREFNSAVYAMMRLQEQMHGKAEQSGFASEEDIAEWITKMRRKEAKETSCE